MMSERQIASEFQATALSPSRRWARHGHRGGVLWLTGLSGSGKSTLAVALEQELFSQGAQVFVLDGDNLRHGLNGDLGFSLADRRENVRRVAEVAHAFAKTGMIVISAFISPLHADRDNARKMIGAGFHEVYLDADLSVCEKRDPKGLYRKARAGFIEDFTGISSPYEKPQTPELTLHTGIDQIEMCVAELLAYADTIFALSETKPE